MEKQNEKLPVCSRDLWKVQQLGPAATGWVAVFQDEATGYSTMPVMCWATAQWITEFYWIKSGNLHKVKDNGIEVVGLVTSDCGVQAAPWHNQFAGYCGPDEDIEKWARRYGLKPKKRGRAMPSDQDSPPAVQPDPAPSSQPAQA